MANSPLFRLGLGGAVLFLVACEPVKPECAINTDCNAGFVCTMGKCVLGNTGFGGGFGSFGGGVGTTGGGSSTTGGGDGTTGGGTAIGGGDGTTGGGSALGGGDGSTGGGVGVTGGGDGTTGGGSALGGGDGTTGGGVGVTGGGVGVTGGGDGTTGGGVGVTGGGVGVTGGGDGTTGGGVGVTGGGVGVTGGGDGTTGGGVGVTGGGVGVTGGGVGVTGGGDGTTGGGVGVTGGGTGVTGGGVGVTGGGTGVTGGGTGVTGGGTGTGGGSPMACAPMGTLAANSSVTGALSLSGTRSSPLPTCGVFDHAYAENVWQFTVPATANVVLETHPGADGGSVDTTINLRNTCSDTTDLACNDEGGAAPLSRIATTLDAGTYAVLVQEYDATQFPPEGGEYGLSLTLTPRAPNSVCTAPIALAPNSPLTGQNSAAGGSPSSACATTAGGQLFYVIAVPNSQQLSVTVTPTGIAPVSHTVRLLDDCAATSCRSSAAGSSATTTTTVNTSGTTQNIVVSVSPTSPGRGGTFEISATVAPYVPNLGETCSAPQVITTSGTITGQTNVGYIDDISTDNACTGYDNTGFDRVYSVSVPAGMNLSVTMPATNSWDPSLYLVAAPAMNCAATGTTCLDGSDEVGDALGEAVSWTNTSASAVTVYVVVDAWAETESGTYELTFNLGMPPASPYTIATVANACSDLSLAPTLAIVDSTGGTSLDDGNSVATALPFGFTYFQQPVTHFTVNANGFAQLWNTGSPTRTFGGPTYNNVDMPNASAPNSVVAPFWDDMRNRNATAIVRTQVFGTAPNRRFVIEWFDVAPWTSAMPILETMRYQAHFEETTNAIEFHYCQLDAGGQTDTARLARLLGAEATFGLEDAAGMTAAKRAFNTPGTASTATSYRFTP